MQTTTSALRFGAVELDVEQHQLLIDRRVVKLTARASSVLVALVERRDRAVSKNELFELVRPNVVVEENNLQVHLSALRKVLGPQTIATIPGHGYRFMAELDAPALGQVAARCDTTSCIQSLADLKGKRAGQMSDPCFAAVRA